MERRGAPDISKRYFGPAYPHKCRDPKTLFCAHIECQRAGVCEFPNVTKGAPCSSN